MTGLMGRRVASVLATGIICLGALAGTAGPASAAPPGPQAPASPRPAPAGANLIVNGGAEAGATSAHGADAVTIPGWQIRRGLPTVVGYGTAGFPGRADAGTRGRGRQLFTGGAGGTAELTQQWPLRTGAGQPVPAGTRFAVSGWLGGTRTSHAEFDVIFLSGTGQTLATHRIGPVGGSGSAAHPEYAWRRGTGPVPAGTRSVELALDLTTSLTNDDGPDAPWVGYDRAVADGLRFSVSVPARRQVLTAPSAHLPRYQHVFLFYFENEDFSQVIGNTAQAPYLNSLLPKASLLGNFFAEEHPSDGNYLALAGGSTFGVPLTDPAEENPLYTINAPNIGDLVTAAGESWKGYLQSANGPCDDTVHVNYWDDDQPMMYFKDVRQRPSYCATHLVPLPSLATDLSRASTTPNFAWVAPDDCFDMEGCGIRAGDDFLRQQLGLIMRSPAWTRQRSLAIITFDEDNYDHQHPAQKVATLVIGSRGVRQGYVSPVRYTHYSLLRTIEGVLGLGTLTNNDRYAAPTTDVFTGRMGPSAGDSAAAATPGSTAQEPGAATPAGIPGPARPPPVRPPRPLSPPVPSPRPPSARPHRHRPLPARRPNRWPTRPRSS